MSSEHTLYIVATPIGNRDDLSSRAIDVLQHVDRIYAEDTRHSLPLLRHHGIDTRVWALHDHNEESQIQMVLEHLRSGASAALISDAGTPLISDPGFRLVRACQREAIRVSPIPGASALTAALSVCGLPTDRFQFVGFPPARSSARKNWLLPLASLSHTLIIYESPHRIIDCIADLVSVFGGDRVLTVARELTKRFETLLHGTAEEVLARIKADPNQQRGEFVLVVSGYEADDADASFSSAADLDKTLSVLLEHLPVKTVARCAAELCGVTKKQAYDRALKLQGR
ncbi:MAG: 16S rRNA (cytidine(1402)-2'-O)-methyltransferase [Granulosicoccus sp.]